MKIRELTEAGIWDKIAKPNLDAMAKKYLNNFLKKYHDVTRIQSANGIDMTDKENQQKTLAGLIGRYAMLTSDQLSQVKSAIISRDLSDDSQLSRLLNDVIKMTLVNHQQAKAGENPVLGPSDVVKDPNTHADTNSPGSIVSGTTQTAGGVEYVWNGSEWRRGDNGQKATDIIAAHFGFWSLGK